MNMKNMENILNELVAKLLAEGAAEFSQNGLNIKTSYDNGHLNISATFVSPEEDRTSELLNKFEEYVKSLHDDFFIEVVESFEDGELKVIQDKLDSKQPAAVIEGVNSFMTQLKAIAQEKIQSLNKDISEAEKELSELIEIRDSYVHVLNKKF